MLIDRSNIEAFNLRNWLTLGELINTRDMRRAFVLKAICQVRGFGVPKSVNPSQIVKMGELEYVNWDKSTQDGSIELRGSNILDLVEQFNEEEDQEDY